MWRPYRPRATTAATSGALEAGPLLSEFKKGLEQVLTVEDAGAHLDLGCAYGEMGLMADAAREVAIALGPRAPTAVAARAAEWLERNLTLDTLRSLISRLRSRGRG